MISSQPTAAEHASDRRPSGWWLRCLCGTGLMLCGSVAAQPVGAEAVADPLVFAVPEAPAGYASREAVMAAIAVGKVKLIQPSDQLPDSVIEHRDLEYGNVNGRSLKLDLAVPKSAHGPVPGLLFVHGGAWSGGDRSVYRYYIHRFAERGYAAATISYRLSGEAPFPAAVQDCKCAVRWMRSQADKYGIDPERLAIIGGSAGGHLSLMVAYTDDPELEGDGGHAGVSSRVAAVVDFYGPVDLTTATARESSAVRKFLGGAYEEKQDVYEQASPLFHLDKDDPPTLVFHGSIDQVVAITQAERLVEGLKEHQVPYVYDRLDGWPHALDAAEVVNDHCREVMLLFLEHYLDSKNQAAAP
jgi:acetyl esterase/lipase